MTTPPSPEERARSELRANVVSALVSSVVLVLALRGTLASAWFFPLIFGLVMAGLALLSLRVEPELLRRPRIAVVGGILLLAVVIQPAHLRGVRERVRALEAEASVALVERVAPGIPHVARFSPEAGQGEWRSEGGLQLVNFWATWCPPCVAELPMLERFQQANAARGITVVGVTKLYERGDPAAELAELRSFVEEQGVSYPIVVGPLDSPGHAAYRVVSLPSSALVGPNGRVVDFAVGVAGTKRLMARALELAEASG